MKPLLYAALVLGLGVSCRKEDRTTIVFGTVKNEINQPIEGVEMVLYAERGILGSIHTKLKSAKTDAKGEYTISAEIPKEYHSGTVIYDFQPLFNFYKGGDGVYFNGKITDECCRVTVGQKSQYDLVLFRK